MKKVSVQFNLEVGDELTHKTIKDWVKQSASYLFSTPTSIQVNNIVTSKKKKKAK